MTTLSKISIFNKGVHNLLENEDIPKEAIQDEKNWFHQDGQIRLVNGKYLVGTEGVAGKNKGLHVGYKVDGTKILYRKYLTKIQYWNSTTSLWVDTDITALTLSAEYSFANYSSLAGNFIFISGIDGFYKINTANPADSCSLYIKGTNDKGRIMIDKGRLIMWNCSDAAKTSLKMSYIDDQSATVYTTITAEATASLTGTLAFKAGSALRNCFGTAFTITGSGETYIDNKDGTLTGSLGGTGTINYTTGVYTLSNAGVGTCTYQWENSTSKGLADFTFTAIRVASEGNIINQTIGGDAIESVLIGQDGDYYSLKEKSAYRLEIDVEDKLFTNLVYRADMGIPYFRAAISTKDGIVFIDTSKPERPQLTLLTKNVLSSEVEPVVLFPQFDFSKYSYDDCAIDTWDKYIIIACQSSDADFNDTILIGNMPEKTIDIAGYHARTFAKMDGDFYIGSPITDTTYKVFDGFDDDGFVIDNFCTLKSETYGNEDLKKFRTLRIQGLIEVDQNIEVYLNYDESGYQLVGTIDGHGGYVDSGTPIMVGSNMIGVKPIGGDNSATVYPYFYEVKLNQTKFRKRAIKFIATNFGYCSVSFVMDNDIKIFENRIPKRYRVKKT